MDLQDLLAKAWEDVSERLVSYRKEVKELRESVGVWSVNDTPTDLRDQLVRSRAVQDRIEAILADVGLVQSRCNVAVTDKQNAYDDRIREVVENNRVGEYQSSLAQNASFQAKAVEELIALRKAKRLLSDITECYNYIQLRYYGLDKTRRDLDARIKLLTFESHLER